MKKLFSVALMGFALFALSGCDNTELNEALTDISTLEAEVEQLELDLADYESLLSQLDRLEETNRDNEALLEEYESQIADLNQYIADLQDMIYDNQVVVTYEDYSGDLRFRPLGYNDDFDGSLFDLLNSEFDIDYTETDYGNMITGFEHLSPLNGAYIAFYKNGEMSFVGVDSASFEDGDVFAFKVEFWDDLEEDVEEGIQLFLNNLVPTYINTNEGQESLDYNVVSGLGLLGRLDDYVSDEFIADYVAGLSLMNATDYFKAIALLNAAGLDSSAYIESLNAMTQTGSYGATGRQLIALNSAPHSGDYSDFEADALAYYALNTPYDAGLDSGGIDVMALSKYSDIENVSDYIGDYLNWIQTDQLDNGGMMTRDMGWGSSFNAASMSQIVMALLATGESPVSDDYTTNGNTLIDALLLFQTESGSFDWVLTDDVEEDLMFSTPQAFLALVAYQTYSNNGNQAVHPFDAQ